MAAQHYGTQWYGHGLACYPLILGSAALMGVLLRAAITLRYVPHLCMMRIW